MTSLAVAREATSKQAPKEASSRIRLWNGGTVEMKVPRGAKPGNYGEGAERINFLHFAYTVPGGVMNFFVHTDEPELYIGKHVTANAEVYRKEVSDGRSFLHIDLIPTDRKPTHKLGIKPQKEGAEYAPHVVVLKTPPPLKAEIVISIL